MAKTTVKYACKHEVEKDLPAHDFKPNASGKTFLQRAKAMDCKECRAKTRASGAKAKPKTAPKAAKPKAKAKKAPAKKKAAAPAK